MFTNGEVRSVQLLFCGFFSLGQWLMSSWSLVQKILCSSLDPEPTPIPSSDCTVETRNNIYLLDENSRLYQFNPITYRISPINGINCVEHFVYNIAVERNGSLWLETGDGMLHRYDLHTAQCQSPISLNDNQTFNYTLIAMTFLKNSSSDEEALYALDISGLTEGLLVFDTSASNFTSVYSNNDAGNTTHALAASRTGCLYGLGNIGGSFPYSQLFAINVSTTHSISEDSLNNSARYTHQNHNTTVWNITGHYDTFTSYQDDFFLFAGNENGGTTVYLFDISENSTTEVQRLPQRIMRATSSSCLGT